MRALSLAGFVLIVACSSSGGGVVEPLVDAGAPRDGGARDGGSAIDGGLARDGGSAIDGGVAIDGGSAVDGGRAIDGGSAIDGGVAIDGGSTIDGGLALDGGSAIDGGADTDGGAQDMDGGGLPACGRTLQYERILQTRTTSDLADVAWHPDGSWAIVAAADGSLLRYDAATREVTVVDRPGQSMAHIAFVGAPANWLASGSTRVGGSSRPTLFRPGDDGGTASFVAPSDTRGATWLALGPRPSTSEVWTLSDAYNPIRVYRFELETNTLTGDVGYATFVNVYGIAWGPNPYGTNEVAVLAGGINGAQILLFDPADSTGTRLTAVPNVRTSNLSTIVRRPGANEYFLCDFVANLIRFDGALTSIRASNWSSCNAIGMREDGSRALFVGRPTGVPLVGRVALYDGVTGSFTPSDITDVSIPGFSEAPYYGDSNAHLRAAAWRPGHCEGLIVANKGFGTNPYGLLIRFEAPGP